VQICIPAPAREGGRLSDWQKREETAMIRRRRRRRGDHRAGLSGRGSITSVRLCGTCVTASDALGWLARSPGNDAAALSREDDNCRHLRKAMTDH